MRRNEDQSFWKEGGQKAGEIAEGMWRLLVCLGLYAYESNFKENGKCLSNVNLSLYFICFIIYVYFNILVLLL